MKSDLFNFAEPEDLRKLVGFFVGDVRWGIDIMRVTEIVNPGEVVRVPSMPGYIVGMADHRGAVMPIIDLRVKFGLGSLEVNKRTKWILVKVDGRDFGLQVDRVTNVLKLGPSQLRQKPSMDEERETAWIAEVYSDEDGLVLELDLDAVTRGARPRNGEAAPEEGGR